MIYYNISQENMKAAIMECLICKNNNKTFIRQDLTQHIYKTHKMTIKEYKTKFNQKHLIDENLRIKRKENVVKGNRRIGSDGLTGYQRSGKKASKTLKQIESNGLTRAQNRGKKGSETRKRINENGLSINQMIRQKAIKTLQQIGENGLTGAKNAAIKAAKTMKNTIHENGLNTHQMIGQKVSNAMKQITENGLTRGQTRAKKAAETMKNTIEENGLTITQNINIKMSRSMRKIGEDGLTGFERAFKNGAGKATKLNYYNSELYYQGRLEKFFLDLVNKLNLIDKIKKPKSIIFEFDNKRHIYLPDFQINTTVTLFEIKSLWWYDNNGKNLEFRKRNNLKWKMAILRGFKLCVIWNNKWITYPKLNDFDDIEKSLYSENIEFNKEVLLSIFENTLYIPDPSHFLSNLAL